jgi:lipoprotein-anchoring transpeptidase ErfK/SrfK
MVAVLGASACQPAGKVGAAGQSSSAGSTAAEASPSVSPPAAITFAPATGASDVRMDQPVTVQVDQGTLTSVQLRSATGDEVTGEFDAAKGQWHSSGPLSPNTSYTATALAASLTGDSVTQTSTFTTLKPANTSSVVLVPGDDWTVGVGMPIVVQFGRNVQNKAAAVKALTVTTTPKVEGAWHWMNSSSVWWRPKNFWPAGTKVHVTAAIGSAELSPGVWGRRTYTSTFSIGSSVINTVDVNRHVLTVTNGGKVVRVLPVTTGKQGFLTRGGTKVIMEKLESVRMNAATTGTDPKDPEFYDEIEHWAMRLTWSGEYLHARPGSDWAFGRTNISHGCTGMSNSNAKWLFDYSKIGDVVRYTGSSRPLEWGNGYTAWEMSYTKWAAGSTSL